MRFITNYFLLSLHDHDFAQIYSYIFLKTIFILKKISLFYVIIQANST